jgi:hypothetical protein
MTVIFWGAQGPWNLTGPTRKVHAAGTRMVAEGTSAPHAWAHAASNALQRGIVGNAYPEKSYSISFISARAYTYLGVIRGALASRSVLHDVEDAAATGAGHPEAREQQEARADRDDSDGALRGGSESSARTRWRRRRNENPRILTIPV